MSKAYTCSCHMCVKGTTVHICAQALESDMCVLSHKTLQRVTHNVGTMSPNLALEADDRYNRASHCCHASYNTAAPLQPILAFAKPKQAPPEERFAAMKRPMQPAAAGRQSVMCLHTLDLCHKCVSHHHREGNPAFTLLSRILQPMLHYPNLVSRISGLQS